MTAILAADRDRQTLEAEMQRIGRAARDAARTLAIAAPDDKTRALKAAAAAVRRDAGKIVAANQEDAAEARRAGLSASMIDRLMLDDRRVAAVADGLDAIAALPDPVGTELARWQRPNGLDIARVRVPLGVIGIIYESRPNVTADAGALCLRAGNACILRGGSESFRSSRAIADCLVEGLGAAGLPAAAIQLVPTRDRAAVGLMLTMPEHIDVIVPRGGKALIERVLRESRVPVLAHLEGNCHVYVDGAAELAMARRIAVNAKMRRTSVCGAAETLLVDRTAAGTHLAPLVKDLLDAGCAVRGDDAAQKADPRVTPAADKDWDTEFLDAIIAVKLVDGVQGAIDHINRHGSHHTDSIVTDDKAVADRFLREVDSGIVLWNASTQFADGGEFGMGAEIGISTSRLHARGPVGAEQLTSFKYVVRGSGQIRP